MRIENRCILDVRKSAFNLGKQGENRATRFVIDISPWLRDHPDGKVRGTFLSPTKHLIPILLIRHGDTVNWTITRNETYDAGDGRVEFALIGEQDTVLKSAIGNTFVSRSLIADKKPVDPPVVEVNYAETAGQLEHPRRIALVGDATGETMFDGTSDVEIETSVANLSITIPELEGILNG